MRVKKFEAKSMKDALKMVKAELGPDAVILGARENKRSFGLGGDSSFEITAAVSESTLQKKKFVESRLKPQDRERFQASQARQQRQVIEKMVSRRIAQQNQEREFAHREETQRENARKPITSISYIDIPDDSTVYARRGGVSEAAALKSHPRPQVRAEVGGGLDTVPTPAQQSATARIKSLAKEAWLAEQALERKSREAARGAATGAPLAASGHAPTAEVESLKTEIKRLQSMIEGFQKVPQTFQGLVHPGADFGLSYDFSAIFQKLTEAGVASELAAEISLKAQSEIDPLQAKKRSVVEAWVAKWFLHNISVCERPFSARYQVFAGPSGGGKTSQLVKAAAQLVIRDRKKVAIVSTDTSKVGAVDQLKIYCQILNVPFAVIRNREDWVWLESQIASVDHVLVDMPGVSLRDADEISRIRSILPSNELSQVHLCLSSAMKESDALEAVRRFRVVQPTDLVFTGLDLSIHHGVIATVQIRSGLPLHSFGIGPRVPEDFEYSTKERVLDLIFKLSSLKRPTEK